MRTSIAYSPVRSLCTATLLLLRCEDCGHEVRVHLAPVQTRGVTLNLDRYDNLVEEHCEKATERHHCEYKEAR